jgi:hypothetical protein
MEPLQRGKDDPAPEPNISSEGATARAGRGNHSIENTPLVEAEIHLDLPAGGTIGGGSDSRSGSPRLVERRVGARCSRGRATPALAVRHTGPGARDGRRSATFGVERSREMPANAS